MTPPRKNALEWTVFAVSGAMVLALFATLVYVEATRPETPPELRVQALEGRDVTGGFAVGLRIENRGGTTAANVRVEARLGDGAQAERGEVFLPFVPAGSSRAGEVVFSRRPATGEVRTRVIGYELP